MAWLSANVAGCLDFAQHDKTAKRSSGSLLRHVLRAGASPAACDDAPWIYYLHPQSYAIKDYEADPRVVREMVNRLVLAVTGQSDVEKAWASLVSPNDRVGIKICAAGGELFTTHHAIVKTRSLTGWCRQVIPAAASSFGTGPLVESKRPDIECRRPMVTRSKPLRHMTGMTRKPSFLPLWQENWCGATWSMLAILGEMPLFADADATSNVSSTFEDRLQ